MSPAAGDNLRLQKALMGAQMISLTDEVRKKARNAYDTGDRKRSAVCISSHLTPEHHLELRAADRYNCPVCGHLLKLRR